MFGTLALHLDGSKYIEDRKQTRGPVRLALFQLEVVPWEGDFDLCGLH